MTVPQATKILKKLDAAWSIAYKAECNSVLSALEDARSAVYELQKNEVCTGCNNYLKSWFDHAKNCRKA